MPPPICIFDPSPMTKPLILFTALALASVTTAQGTLSISIGIRETGAGGSTFTAIGADGGSAGGIEWVNRDGQTLVLDGTWQQFTFDFDADTLSGFAGATANNMIDGDFGTLEHIRILNSGGVTGEIDLWIDDIENTIVPTGQTNPVSTVFGDFQGYGDGDEVIFQEPSFSGSTASNLVAGGTAGVDNFVASRSSSDKISFEFVDGTTTRWVRLTTFQSTNLRNPTIRFDQDSTLSFWMRGGVAQENLGSQGPGDVIAEMVGTGLAVGDSSTYHVAGADANAAGVVFFSFDGGTDLPIFGGNMVSFSNLILGEVFVADGMGRASVTLPGSPPLVDLVVQSAYFDMDSPATIGISNAVLARFGR